MMLLGLFALSCQKTDRNLNPNLECKKHMGNFHNLWDHVFELAKNIINTSCYWIQCVKKTEHDSNEELLSQETWTAA